ncbi:MAG: hypothetical protein ACYSUL_13785 [Planctomycetota bacterium]|jgi:hypothetical protein
MTILELGQKRKDEYEKYKVNWDNHHFAIGFDHLSSEHAVGRDQAAIRDYKDADSNIAYADSSDGFHW